MSDVLAILPMSTAFNGRSSSTLRRIKTYLRSCTSENTLNGLTVLISSVFNFSHLYLYKNLTQTVESILYKTAGKQIKLDSNL